MSTAVKGDPVGSASDRGVAKRTFDSANILKTTLNCALAFPIIVRSVFRPKTSKAAA